MFSSIITSSTLTKEIDVSFAEISKLPKDVKNMDSNMKRFFEIKLNQQIAAKCIEDGYVMPNSIRVSGYSYGLVDASNIKYSVLFNCDICFPTAENVIECVVQSISNGGIRAVLSDIDPSPLIIFVAREIVSDASLLSGLNEGDRFHAKIIGVQYELNDPYISVLANIHQ